MFSLHQSHGWCIFMDLSAYFELENCVNATDPSSSLFERSILSFSWNLSNVRWCADCKYFKENLSSGKHHRYCVYRKTKQFLVSFPLTRILEIRRFFLYGSTELERSSLISSVLTVASQLSNYTNAVWFRRRIEKLVTRPMKPVFSDVALMADDDYKGARASLHERPHAG